MAPLGLLLAFFVAASRGENDSTPLTHRDFKYTYLLGDRVTFENLSGRGCAYYNETALAAVDYDKVCKRGCSASTLPPRGRPKPGTYCDSVLLDVGCKHCGTNSIHGYFKSHPDIGVNLKKPLKLAHQPFTPKNNFRALYRTFFAPQRANGDGPYGFDVSENVMNEPLASLAQINVNLPRVKILAHLRKPVDRDMSLVYESQAEAYHKVFTRDLANGDFLKRWHREHQCYADHLEELLRVVGPGRMLVVETQRLFWHRDEVFAEILKFAGLPPFDLQLPKVIDCKAERYKGEFAGCYTGASRVAPETHALADALPYVQACRARLERLLGDRTLFTYTRPQAEPWAARHYFPRGYYAKRAKALRPPEKAEGRARGPGGGRRGPRAQRVATAKPAEDAADPLAAAAAALEGQL